MSQEILQVGRLSPTGEADIQAAFKVSLLSEQADPETFLVSEGHRFHGLITIAPIGASKTLLSKLPNLKVIACRGIGVEKIDLDMRAFPAAIGEGQEHDERHGEFRHLQRAAERRVEEIAHHDVERRERHKQKEHDAGGQSQRP